MSKSKKNTAEIEEGLQKFFNLNFNDKELLFVYNLGAKKFEVGDYEGALAVFLFLNASKPNTALYLKSAASCYQNMERYEDAFYMYQSTYIVDTKTNYDCLFYLGFCGIKLGQKDEAKGLLNLFVDNYPDHELVKKAKLLLNGLK